MKAEGLSCLLIGFSLIQLQSNNYIHIALRNKHILPLTYSFYELILRTDFVFKFKLHMLLLKMPLITSLWQYRVDKKRI